MLILLPPSEGKSEPRIPSPLDLSKLSHASTLNALRKTALKQAGLHSQKVQTDSAMTIYNGVLYKALDWHSLPARAKTRGEKSLVIISALFGLVAPLDRIPRYKFKIQSAFWKQEVTQVLSGRKDDLIIDCRSSTYKGVWNPPIDRTVVARVFQVIDGERSVVTHMSKKYRGELVRNILLMDREPRNLEELYEIAKSYFRCELITNAESEPAYLDLLVEL